MLTFNRLGVFCFLVFFPPQQVRSNEIRPVQFRMSAAHILSHKDRCNHGSFDIKLLQKPFDFTFCCFRGRVSEVWLPSLKIQPTIKTFWTGIDLLIEHSDDDNL